MVKQFGMTGVAWSAAVCADVVQGWEGLVKGQLEQKRKEELKWILRYSALSTC
jgi:hypothetical protein